MPYVPGRPAHLVIECWEGQDLRFLSTVQTDEGADVTYDSVRVRIYSAGGSTLLAFDDGDAELTHHAGVIALVVDKEGAAYAAIAAGAAVFGEIQVTSGTDDGLLATFDLVKHKKGEPARRPGAANGGAFQVTSAETVAFTVFSVSIFTTENAMLVTIYDPQDVAGDAFARTNHTGMQAVSTLSDFTASVTAHADVAGNTAARHTQGTDAGLDTGGANAVSAAEIRPHIDDVSGNPHGVTAAQAAAMPASVSVNAQTGASYQIALSDQNQVVELANASDITLTVPTNATTAFPVGAVVGLLQTGAGQVTIAAAGGVMITSKDGNLKLTGQYSAAALHKVGTDTWRLIGDLSA